MSCDQFMADRITAPRYFVKRSSVNGRHYSARMANRDRTEFGSRVIQARKNAGLTQHGLSAATGIKQSTIAEMEVSGQSSLMTPQIARACGVDAYWLATGEGPMLGRQADATNGDLQVEDALSVLGSALQRASKSARMAIEPLLASMASDPADAKNKSDLILTLLVTGSDKRHAPSHDEVRSSHIYVKTKRLTLGDENGRSDTVTNQATRKK